MLTVLIRTNLYSQDPYALVIDKSKGLPSNAVYQLFQDSRGFIWLATGEGLCRYDGFEFKTYANHLQTSKSGSDIHEDKYGRIWYENFDGYIHYVENDSLKSIQQNTPVGYHHFGIIDDRLFVVQKKGIDIYDLTTLRLLKTIELDISIISRTQQTKTKFYVGELYLDEIDTNGNISKTPWAELQKDQKQLLLLHQNADTLFMMSKDKKQHFGYLLAGKTVTPKFTFSDIEFVQATSYSGDIYWICTPKGVYAVNENGNYLNNKRPYFSDKSISCVLQDREGNFWFSTTNQGLMFVPDIRSQHVTTSYKPFKLALHKNHLYVGTKNDELHLVDLNTLQSKRLHQGNSNLEVHTLYLDSIDHKLFYLSKEFKVLKENGELSFSWTSAIKDIKRIDQKYLSFAASGIVGLMTFHHTASSKWDSLAQKNPSYEGPVVYSRVVSGVRGKSVAYNANNATIYFATNNGLIAASPQSVQTLKYINQDLFLAKLQQVGNRIFGLSADGKLFEIDDANQLSLHTLNNTIHNQSIRDIIAQKHFLFLFTEKQLLFFDFKKNKLDTVMVNLEFEEISDLAIWKNQLLLTTRQGLLFLNFETKREPASAPAFIINHVKVNNKLQREKIKNELAYFENNIEINYSVLSFKADSKLPVYYRINERDWEVTSSETRTLKLPSLAPGNYSIAFRLAENAPVIQSLHFQILKPFWLRSWFILNCVLIVVSVLYGIYKWQITILRRRNQLLSEKIDLEQSLNSSILTSIKSQMNPHFFYNALNTIQSFIFTDDKKNATNYLSKFSKLTRMILEMSDKEKITLTEETSALHLYLEIEKARFNTDFDYRITLDETIDKELIKIPSMLIQPYVENAIKHGLLHKKGEKRLCILFQKEGSNLKITIDDNGIGRKRSAELNAIKQNLHHPFSTVANQKRLEILNRGKEKKTAIEMTDKMDANQNPTGTTVKITLPIN